MDAIVTRFHAFMARLCFAGLRLARPCKPPPVACCCRPKTCPVFPDVSFLAHALCWHTQTAAFPLRAARYACIGADLSAVGADEATPGEAAVAAVAAALAAALKPHGFDPALPTVWVAEALLYYMPLPAAARLLAAAAALSAPGSRLVATVLDRELLEASRSGVDEVRIGLGGSAGRGRGRAQVLGLRTRGRASCSWHASPWTTVALLHRIAYAALRVSLPAAPLNIRQSSPRVRRTSPHSYLSRTLPRLRPHPGPRVQGPVVLRRG